MKRIINALSFVSVLLVFTSCGSNLTDVTYTSGEGGVDLIAIRFYDNGEMLITEGMPYMEEESPLYMCFGWGTKWYRYKKEGNTIKLLHGDDVQDQLKLEGGVIKYGNLELRPDKRFSTIKRSGKYGGTIYASNWGSESVAVLAFINETQVYQIDRSKKVLCNYEIEDGKVIIDTANLILEEGKDKLIYNSSWNTLVLKKHSETLNDLEFYHNFKAID